MKTRTACRPEYQNFCCKLLIARRCISICLLVLNNFRKKFWHSTQALNSKHSIALFNTLSKKKEVFEPIAPGEVKIYQCGPTVYWTQHIGNIRAMVIADILVRTFKYVGYEVKFARNYTDVGHLTSDGDDGEDRMEKGVRREGTTPNEIAQKYIDIFEKDIMEINTIPPNFRPRATEYIPEMIEMVATLLEKGFAYNTPLAIYFDISKAKDYTGLSGQILENNIEDAGKGTVSDSNKKNPEDFSIWFFKAGAHENALQTWKNPFSEKQGFPGWHLECSAMIKKLLGDTIDIHMGGIEHITVHHTNEIAQSESTNNKSLSHFWMHNEHLLVDSKKMSKSEGTTYALADIKEKGFSARDLRYLFLNAHYKSKQNFTWEALEGAQTALRKLSEHIGEESGVVDEKYQTRFTEIIANDLNTPQALALAWEVAKDDTISPADKTATLLDFDRVLGLGLTPHRADIIPAEITTLANTREQARKNKDWTESDRLRDEIKSLGYDVADTPEGPKVSMV